MPRISQLPSLTAADNSDEIAIVDVSAAATKKITRGDLLKAPLPANSVTTAAITDGAVTAPKIDFTTFAPTTSNGWTVSADGRVATKRLSMTGFQSFGSAGGTNWSQTQSIGAFPDGFTAADCTVSITRVRGSSIESLIVAGVLPAKTSLYMANTSNQSGIGSTGTTWINDIVLVRTN